MKTQKDTATWRTRGYLRPEDVDLPSQEELAEGPVPIIECPQRIPCDPCGENCPAGAIKMNDINGIPEVDSRNCTGCSLCVAHCPGLAIFTIDCSPEKGCEITIPYEFDLPETGEEVEALNRKGEKITTSVVKSVKSKEDSAGDTSTVTIKIPEEHINEVRNIGRVK
ncbi:4Fe-4S dicluster domain-containing protein [Candidatus Bipolaricaulota bacterium]|nr:4Fe-4S dicluster domain-containing protein [Candidatus Bipolaricaulota bacterium]